MKPIRAGKFVRKVRRLARKRDIAFRLDKKRGKGSHGMLYFGDRQTVVKDLKKWIGPGLLRSMLDDLGLTEDDLK